MKLVTQETARAIWCCYSEIENGTKLLETMEEQAKNYRDPNPRNAFGERRNLQLGVPSGESSHRLLDVQPALAMACIKAHIAQKRALLETYCLTALAEMSETPPISP